MRYVTLATLVVATVGLAACEQQAPDRSPTAPDAPIAFAKGIGGQCDDARARLIATEQANLWAKPQLTTAKALFNTVVSNCSNDAGKSAMLTYIQWTIDNRGSIITQSTGTKEGNLLTHWNDVFPYVGYVGNDAPTAVPTTIFTDAGVAQVVPNPVDSVEIAPANHVAAMKIYHQNDGTGDPRPHLFVIYPREANCLGTTNLHQFGPCYEFGAFPKVDPAFDPKVKVGVCQALNHDENLPYGSPALGHFNGNFVEIPGQTAYPTFCTHADNVADAGAWNGGFGGIAKRVAWVAKRAFGVQPLYAVHGGLGGLGGGLSPFGGVNLEVFHATFENETIGAKPTAPEVGTWDSATATPPGSITVQASLGASATGQLVVLNQAGGACKNCGGLLLKGKFFVEPGNPPPSIGTYETTFLALQDNANMKAATFKLRDSGNRVLAQVSFVVQSNINKVLFNGNDTGKTWTRHVPISFKIRTNLVTHATSLWMDNQLIADNVDFMNTHTTNFTNIAADFGGIDSGIMGWDEIRVVRIQD